MPSMWTKLSDHPRDRGLYRNERGTIRVMYQSRELVDGKTSAVQRATSFPRGPYTITDPTTGSSKRVTEVAAARHFKAEQDAGRRAGRVRDSATEELTVGDFFPRFMAAKDRRPTTIDQYERTWKNWIAPTFADETLRSVKVTRVREWYAALDGGRGARRAALKLIRSIFAAAVADGLIPSNPAAGVHNGGPDTIQSVDPADIPTDDEIEKLAVAVGPRYRALVKLLAYGGLRIGEAVALRVDRIDFLRRRITIDASASEVGGELVFGATKTGASSRTITAPAFLIDELSAHVVAFPTDSGLVFSAPDGGPIRPNNFRNRVFGPALEAAKLRTITVHDLRHTCASTLIAQGASIVDVAHRLGHSNAMVTARVYAHILRDVEDRLAERQDAVYRSRSAR